MKILLILTLFSSLLISQEYENNQIRLRLHSNAEILQDIKSNSSNELLSDLLGEYEVKPYLSDNILKAYKIALEKKQKSYLLSENNPLENIFIVEYSNSIDPIIASKKLQSIEDVEYAEPVYKRYIVSVPNDPQATQQYHHNLLKTFEAWDLLDTTLPVIIGIVDTGVDLEHEDLKDKIWYNQGEIGVDKNGNQKNENGIDDDENGFVDDWRGWDAALGDNDPSPGNTHGTHVAGIAAASINNNLGVAGVSPNAKIMAVKAGPDNSNSRGMQNPYEALLYAGIAGADVINNSWGGGGGSQAEASVVKAVVDLGAVIICAAGNDASFRAFFPASFDDVISVASTDQNDRQSSFSNYHPRVDVSAPGTSILSTLVDNEYGANSGTSMASPVAAGVAALIKSNYPQYNNLQIMEHLMATTDDIEANLASTRKNNFGTGRVSALNALENENPILVRLDSYIVEDYDGNGVFEPGDNLKISVNYSNKLNDVSNLTYEVFSKDKDGNDFITVDGSIGNINIGGEKQITFDYKLPDNLGYDYNYQLPIKISNNDNYESVDNISFTVNQSYRTHLEPNITFTVNSKGNIGYNDYPSNEQGVGIVYDNQYSLMYEGGIIVANSFNQLANSARGSNQMQQDTDFNIVDIVKKKEIGNTTIYSNKFSDKGLLQKIGVEIQKNTFYVNEGVLKDAIIVQHNVKNITEGDFGTLFLGYYFDWDLGQSGRNDLAYWDNKNSIMIQQNEDDSDIPKVGLAMISGQSSFGYALDNDGNTDINPGVYDGFTREEKWNVISGNLQRVISNKTDASSIISAGPIYLAAGESELITMVIMSSYDKGVFPEIVKEAKKQLNNLTLLNVESKVDILNLYPNPTSDFINYELTNEFLGNIEITIYDIRGNLVKTSNINSNSSNFLGSINVSELNTGSYILKIKSNSNETSKKFIIKR